MPPLRGGIRVAKRKRFFAESHSMQFSPKDPLVVRSLSVKLNSRGNAMGLYVGIYVRIYTRLRGRFLSAG